MKTTTALGFLLMIIILSGYLHILPEPTLPEEPTELVERSPERASNPLFRLISITKVGQQKIHAMCVAGTTYVRIGVGDYRQHFIRNNNNGLTTMNCDTYQKLLEYRNEKG